MSKRIVPAREPANSLNEVVLSLLVTFLDRIRKQAASLACIGTMLAAAACTPATDQPGPAGADPEQVFSLFSASDALIKKWRRIQIWSKSDWRLSVVDEQVAIEPVVDKSSTALVRWIEFDTEDCPLAEWTWRVEEMPRQADITSRASEDMAASLMFVFGDPGNMSNPDPVPTLRYVWASDNAVNGAAIASPYYPEFLRSIVVRQGDASDRWVTERRNLRDDYQAAFGGMPTEPVMVFALFSDNDHLGDPVKAYYRSAHVLCSELPDSDSILP